MHMDQHPTSRTHYLGPKHAGRAKHPPPRPYLSPSTPTRPPTLYPRRPPPRLSSPRHHHRKTSSSQISTPAHNYRQRWTYSAPGGRHTSSTSKQHPSAHHQFPMPQASSSTRIRTPTVTASPPCARESLLPTRTEGDIRTRFPNEGPEKAYFLRCTTASVVTLLVFHR